jgi:radical SAM superfamily enzyme YgiQ (UPF0313 family)
MDIKKITLVAMGNSRKEYPYLMNWLYLTSPGIHFVKAMLEGHGYDVALIDKVDENLVIDEVIDRLNDKKQDAILFNQFNSSREDVRYICSSIGGDAVRGIGGQDATFHSRSLGKSEFEKIYSHVDFIWQGECENGLIEFLSGFQRSVKPVRVDNLNNRVHDLDSIPVMKHNDYCGETAFLVTSRGCLPGGCDFCTTPAMYRDGWKGRTVENICEELRNIKNSKRFHVYIVDDNFLGMNLADMERGIALIRRCGEEGLKVFPMTSVEKILEVDKAGLLGEFTGIVHAIFLGVENGSPCALGRLGKRVNAGKHAERSERALEALYRHEISPYLGYINFNPESDRDELLGSARFLHDTNEASFFYYFFNRIGILEGTRLYDKYVNKLRISGGEYTYDFNDPLAAAVFAVLLLVQEHTRVIDFLHFEATQLIYMNGLAGTPSGLKYAALKKTLNGNNYDFFLNTVDVCERKDSPGAILDLIDDFKLKVNNSILNYTKLIPEIVDQSKYVLREPMKYVDSIVMN